MLHFNESRLSQVSLPWKMKWHTLVRSWYQKNPQNLSLHSVEICKFFPHDFFAKISSNQIFHYYTVNQFDEKFSQWGKISDIFTLCIMFLKYFRQKFRESNAFTKEITKELIWRNIFQWEYSSRFSTLWKRKQYLFK